MVVPPASPPRRRRVRATISTTGGIAGRGRQVGRQVRGDSTVFDVPGTPGEQSRGVGEKVAGTAEPLIDGMIGEKHRPVRLPDFQRSDQQRVVAGMRMHDTVPCIQDGTDLVTET